MLWGGGGNVTATVPIMERLIERGHEVSVLGDATVRDDLPVGTPLIEFTRVPPIDSRDPARDPIRDWDGRTPIGGMVRGYRWLLGGALRAAEDLLDHVGEHPTDVVVADTMLPGALIGAEAAGLASASLVHTPWPFPTRGALAMFAPVPPARGAAGRARDRVCTSGFAWLFQRTAPRLNAERAAVGLPPIASAVEQFLRADRVLVLTSPSFDVVPAGLPAHATYVGAPMPRPSPRAGGAGGDSSGSSEWSDSTAPLVLVSLSSTFQDQGALLGRIVASLGRLPVRGLVTTTAIDPATIAAPAPNVEVTRYARHVDVLPHCRVVVTHGGHGTTIAALAHGVPVLCLPHGRDQPGVAARAVASGAGIRLAKGASTERIVAAVRRLLDDPSYLAAAKRLAGRIAAEGDGADNAATALEAIRRTPSA